MARLIFWLCLALSASFAACRSSDKEDEKAELQATPAAKAPAGKAPGATAPKAQEAVPAMVDCSKRPPVGICCQAMTPSCNDCREKARRALEEWDAYCLKPAAVEPECSKGPPVSACCNDDGNDECATCREAAFTTLMAWKERCANADKIRCDAEPPQTMCCSAITPSCEACQARNRRAHEEWRVRCGREEIP